MKGDCGENPGARRDRVEITGMCRDQDPMQNRGNCEDQMPPTVDMNPSFLRLWRARFQGAPLYCANEGSEGVLASEGWRDYTFRATTVGQKRIEKYLLKECGPGSNLFHVGIGNSLLAQDFHPRVSMIVGVSIEHNEVHHGLQSGASNYFPFVMNKYSLQFSQAFSSDYDFVVDNNPSTFCCCFFHLVRMMTAYRRLMRNGGRIVTERIGLGWVVKGGNPRWGFDFEDWGRIAEVLGLTTSNINGEVYTMQHHQPV